MKPKTKTTASLAVVGVDIGKEAFHLVGLGADGTIALRRKIRRLSLKDVFEQLPPCVVGMEACLSAHFVSRTLRALGHEPRIAHPGIGVTSASRRRCSIDTFPPQEARIPRALQSSVEPSRPPRCLRRCGNPRRFFARVAALNRRQAG